MKSHLVTLAGTMLLLLAVACKKETANTPDPTTLQKGAQEALAAEPITPLDKPIPLPAGSRNAARTTEGHIPIIMVHGLGGFGPGEMLGHYHYWGGADNIPPYLSASGYPAFAAKVGPLSSNYDRAVELYYYIKGGYVDYGKFHSGKYGHNQMKGRYYPGIYPQWDADHPVHLLGHSMGGITVRKLVTLLEKGDLAEKQDPDHAPLFDGGRNGWVKSVTSISTPHNGATLSYILLHGYIPFVRQFITTAAAFAGIVPGIERIYDFSLEQWGLEQQDGESWAAYANRVEHSVVWQTEDYSGHDVTPDMVIPIAYPTPILMGIGNYTRNQPGKIVIDAKWWPNDGAANVYGQSGPALGIIREYNSAVPLEKGVWNHMGVYNGYDHFDVIGIGYFSSIRPFYKNIAELLAAIE